MGFKPANKSIYLLLILFVVGFLHTLPLWNVRENLAAGYGDPMAHAAIAGWYCSNVLTGNFHTNQFMAPYGVDVSGNYDSPFPFILTCPFMEAGPQMQFHIFTLLQILLIILGAWLVATHFLRGTLLQLGYVLFVWWCGFYIVRSHQHVTLLSMIWGMQFVFYAVMNLKPRDLKNVLGSATLLGLSYTGSFQNIPVLLVFTLGLVALKFWTERKEILHKKALINLGLGLVVSSVIFFGFWWQMIAFTLKHGSVAVENQRQLYNLDLLSALLPASTSMIYSWLPDLPKLPMERENPLDLLVLVLVLISLFAKKFWKDSFRVVVLVFAVFYYVLALGPELRINNEVASYLDFNTEIFNHFPFTVTRTTGRLAMVTSLGFVLLAFLYLNDLKDSLLKKIIAGIAVVWILIMGPAFNNMWFFPTLNFKTILPEGGLTFVRNMPPETIVMQIPSAWAQDPSANFLQLFHGKNITSAYLAYTAYNKELAEKILPDPLLGKMGCEGEATAFTANPFLTNADQLRAYMHSKHLRAIIINKQILMGNPGCKPLLSWVQQFTKLPWFKAIEENNYFVIAEIQ